MPLDPIEFRRRNALKTGGRTIAGNTYSRLDPHAGDSGQAGEASDLAAASRREGARTASRDRRRHGRGLCHQGLRHRRGLFAGARGNRPGGPDCHPWRRGRDGQRHRDGARQSGGGPSGWRGRRSLGRAKSTPSARLRSSRPATRTRWTRRHRTPPQRDPRWVPAISSPTSCFDRRPRRDPCGGRGRARRVPLRIVAGGARVVGYRADRSKGRAMGDGALAGRPADHAGARCVAAAGHRGKGACAQWRDRGDGARLFPLGVGASDLPDRRTTMVGRDRRVGRAQGLRQIRARSIAPASNFRPPTYNRFGTTYTALCGTVVRIEIERATGALRIAKAYSVLECGQALAAEALHECAELASPTSWMACFCSPGIEPAGGHLRRKALRNCGVMMGYLMLYSQVFEIVRVGAGTDWVRPLN